MTEFPKNKRIQHGRQSELQENLRSFLKEQQLKNDLTDDTIYEALDEVKDELELGDKSYE